MTLQEIKTVIDANIKQDRPRYEGLSSADIGTYSRALMWGDDGEAWDESVYRAYCD